jgi:CRISPR-associated endonuclease/helicase Cas3
MSRGFMRSERLEEMKRLYIMQAFSDIEMGKRLDVDRTTVFKDRRDLESEYPFVQDSDGRWRIDKKRYVSAIKFNLHEALAVYLAARRVSRQTRIAQPHVANAIQKLAAALRQPMTERLVAAGESLLAQSAQPERVKVLEAIAEAWASQQKVRITHQGLRARQAQTHLVSPYLIEPSLLGDGTYLIGHSDVFNDVATFKVERIERAVVTGEPFTLPQDFDEAKLLQHAWGIWYGEGEPQTVKLRFFGEQVTRRVKETIWHPSQKPIEDTSDGCIWTAEVAEWREMVPWVRGWGADVEVVEPEELRETLMAEVRKLTTLYHVAEPAELPLFRRLWGKTSDDNVATHPLICHMLDVAQVAALLWNDVLTDSIRRQLADVLGLEPETAGRVMAFWVGVHDLGKASPAFQRKHAPAKRLLEDAGLRFPLQVGEKPCHHGAITSVTLPGLLQRETGLSVDWADKVAIAVGGHHGDWPTAQDMETFAAPGDRGNEAWDRVRHDLVLCLKEILAPPNVTFSFTSIEAESGLLALLSGLTSVADWIGSMEEYFQPASEYVDPGVYAEQTKGKARQALRENGWLGWRPPENLISFELLFNVSAPRSLQETVVELAPKIDQPALVIIEAPTGVGKTEAALYLADYWTRTLQQRGIYVAMPTMATSNQMYTRLREVLTRRYPSDLVNYHLLHGNALLMENDEIVRLAKINEDAGRGTVAALSWFTKRKRGLLAPFAVGTVDQALMSILQTEHFFVRLFGLSHKTVIFDEVHAYDTYMDELFYRLLRWLRVVGTSVIVLSATLSERSRRALVEAYTGQSLADFPQVEYPALTWTTGGRPCVVPLAAPDRREVGIERICRQPEAIAERLKTELVEGGCAAVICNTVDRAQKVYGAIRSAGLVPEDDLILFHARFPLARRAEIERDEVVKRFGKRKAGENKVRGKAIVVATQVIEQSLDLDFDLMVSDLAPVDLIIQRAGRLHRHEGNVRPAGLRKPRLLVAMPDMKDDVPAFTRGDVFVYGRYFLLRSYLVLQSAERITTPEQTQPLIEAVYGAETPPPSGAFRKELDQARQTMEDEQRKAKREARGKLIPWPNDADLLEEPSACLEEDNPELHRYRQAATRLAPPSITLICLYKTPRGLALDVRPDSLVVDLTQELDFQVTRTLYSRKIEVSDYRLVKYFAAQPIPSAWRENPWLRHARAVELGEGGVYSPTEERWRLKLDHKLGLVIEDQEAQ